MSRPRIHALAWLAWLMAVLIALTTTRNPFYIALVLTWIGAVAAAITRIVPAAERRTVIALSPWRFGLFVVALSALFNLLTVHVGRTILFQMPSFVPIAGGPLTLEALVYGILNGLVIAGLFAAFSTANQVLSNRAVVRLIPRAFYPVAVIVSVAVTFVPSTLSQLQLIREAQAVRGHRMRGLRSWLPLALPLLIGGLERALQLAEAMVARGFATAGRQSTSAQWIALSGLLLFTAGWLLRLVWGSPIWGMLFLLAGPALVFGAIYRAGRGQPHTVYRPEPWLAGDWAVVGGSLVTAAGFLVAWPGLERSSLFYYPYPTVTLPSFHLLLGAATWGLLVPALVLFAAALPSPSGRRSPEEKAPAAGRDMGRSDGGRTQTPGPQPEDPERVPMAHG